MGKSKKSRAGHRSDPVAKTVKPPSDPELAALRESKILPIINNLKSADPKSRSTAASVISSIIQDTKCRKLLLREQIVYTVLTQTLTDAALESRAAGWGILQVLAQEEEADFCVHLYRQDVLTAIEFASKLIQDKVLSKEAPFAKLPKAEKGFISSIAASLVSLLMALAEAEEEILESISNNNPITSLLFSLITYTSQDDEDPISAIRGDAMACLMVLTEDNTNLAKYITSTPGSIACYETLVSLKDEVSGDGVLACTVLHNIYASLLEVKNLSPKIDVADDADLISTLTKAMAGFVPGQSEANGSGCLQPTDDLSLKIQGHALSALNNIAWSVSLIDFSEDSNNDVLGAWTPVARALWQQVVSPILASDTADVDLATQVTSIAWAVARALHGETPLQPNEHRKFVSLYQATKGAPALQDPEDPFQALGVKCVGVLGQLALNPAPVDLNREIGTFLVTLVAGLPGTPTADAVEAFNQVFDIYGNEEYAYDAEVFWRSDFLKHLEGTMSKAKAMAKSVNKSQQPELRDRADEVVMNLTRFLSYKKKHKPVQMTVRERS
ncbi:hypothetical protein TGAM01_v201721 [Trichoderma gamsii]|uniref:SYO1-like TPR repeats domain-containing protein n=1 Tax=Trichoderma gamsii TaxID=398673 RepID=A0A2P4ZYU7_9HYPO|nr:hypothetical protein TGAM01_v201721 [Trichoderma gamsii]PON29472.1 hypothetical protein TGAM01_v201721 [Trichoderma gamsii]